MKKCHTTLQLYVYFFISAAPSNSHPFLAGKVLGIQPLQNKGVGRACFMLSPPASPCQLSGSSLLHPDIGPSATAPEAKGCPGPAEHSLLEDSQGSVSGNSVAGGTKVSRQHEKEKTNLKEGWQTIPSYKQYAWIMEMCSSTSRLTGSELLHYLIATKKSPNRRVSLPSRLLAYHKTNLLLSVRGAGKKKQEQKQTQAEGSSCAVKRERCQPRGYIPAGKFSDKITISNSWKKKQTTEVQPKVLC